MRPCLKHVPYPISCNPHGYSLQKTECQRGLVICLRSHSQLTPELRKGYSFTSLQGLGFLPLTPQPLQPAGGRFCCLGLPGRTRLLGGSRVPGLGLTSHSLSLPRAVLPAERRMLSFLFPQIPALTPPISTVITVFSESSRV